MTKVLLSFPVEGMNFTRAGEATSEIKRKLQQIGLPSDLIRRIVIIAYEAELNIVIHAYEGKLTAEISPEDVTIIATDKGPGIPDIELAMQEGYSTAPPHIRAMGFGAGMGLPNIRKNSDELVIDSVVGEGTVVKAVVKIKK